MLARRRGRSDGNSRRELRGGALIWGRRAPEFPTPATLYPWLLERLELPDGAVISAGFWRTARLQFPKAQRRQWNRTLPMKALPALWEQAAISAALIEVYDWYDFDWEFLEDDLGDFLREYPVGRAEVLVEALLRRDAEIWGRAWVAARGHAPYLAILEAAQPDDSHHERLETLLLWRDLGLFSARDETFCARFPEILASHGAFLRGERDGERAQLCGRDLREVSWPKNALRGADLRGANFRNLDLRGDDFSDCDLRAAHFLAADLRGCDLRRADLREARFDLARLDGAQTQGARTSPDFARLAANSDGFSRKIPAGAFRDREFRQLYLQKYDFSAMIGHDCTPTAPKPVPIALNFADGDFAGASFRGAALCSSNFARCDLRGADFSLADCAHANFSGADLRGAHVGGARFENADFTGAQLGDLTGADRAQWHATAPENSDFRGVQWRDTWLRDRNFRLCDFENADLRDCDLRGAHFSGANLRGADLRGATLTKTDFIGAHLEKARVSAWQLRVALR